MAVGDTIFLSVNSLMRVVFLNHEGLHVDWYCYSMKENSPMKWISRLTDCVDYIDAHLTDEIDVDVLCDMACLSRMYFFRMFEAVTGTGYREYVRNRKMTLAVKDLQASDAKVIDVAFKYGYSSSEAFSRAFKSVHGVSPSLVKDDGVQLKSYGKLTFNISINGDEEINYRIEKKDAFTVLGLVCHTSEDDGRNYVDIPAFWTEVYENGDYQKLCELAGAPDHSFGICMDYKFKTNEFDYWVAVADERDDDFGYAKRIVEAATWAVFEVVGPMPNAMQAVWKKIFRDWLPATGYEIAYGPQIEYYSHGDSSKADYYSEIWIPLVMNES